MILVLCGTIVKGVVSILYDIIMFVSWHNMLASKVVLVLINICIIVQTRTVGVISNNFNYIYLILFGQIR